jgi:hypothetical protein
MPTDPEPPTEHGHARPSKKSLCRAPSRMSTRETMTMLVTPGHRQSREYVHPSTTEVLT